MVIHDLSLRINDVERARAFCDSVLATLGLRCLEASGDRLACAVDTFLGSLQLPANDRPATPGNGAHVALAAENWAVIDTRRAGRRRQRRWPAWVQASS